jgi:hypothetical protein
MRCADRAVIDWVTVSGLAPLTIARAGDPPSPRWVKRDFRKKLATFGAN